MAGKNNFKIEQGATFTFGLVWKDSDGVPVPLTGYTARMQLRYGSYAGAMAIELTTENSGIVINTITSQVTMSISAAQSELLELKPCVYDLEMVKGDTVTRLIEGKVTISPEVTR